MNPNYTILIILIATPVLIFVVWKASVHFAVAATHSIKMRRHEKEMRKLEVARREHEARIENQLRDLTAEVNKQRTEPAAAAAATAAQAGEGPN